MRFSHLLTAASTNLGSLTTPNHANPAPSHISAFPLGSRIARQLPSNCPVKMSKPGEANSWTSCYIPWPTAMVATCASICLGCWVYYERTKDRRCPRCRRGNVEVQVSVNPGPPGQHQVGPAGTHYPAHAPAPAPPQSGGNVRQMRTRNEIGAGRQGLPPPRSLPSTRLERQPTGANSVHITRAERRY